MALITSFIPYMTAIQYVLESIWYSDWYPSYFFLHYTALLHLHHMKIGKGTIKILQPVLTRVVQREILEFAPLSNYWQIPPAGIIQQPNLSMSCSLHKRAFSRIALWNTVVLPNKKLCFGGSILGHSKPHIDKILTLFWSLTYLTLALKFVTLNVKKIDSFHEYLPNHTYPCVDVCNP